MPNSSMERMPVEKGTVLEWASKYPVEADEVVAVLVPKVKQRGFLIQQEFEIVGEWKSPRARPKLKKNTPEHIEEATRIALATPVEEIRIGALLTLNGVGHPMASVFLHWFHAEPYPILDYRALESIAFEMPRYDTPSWLRFVEVWRAALAQAGVDKRTFDRALWMGSKESQEA